MQIEPARFARDRLALHQRDDDVEAFLHAAAQLGDGNADHRRIARQRAGADAEHRAAARHMVELRHRFGEHEGVVVGQRFHAGAEADVFRALGRGGDHQLGRGDHLHRAGMMLAIPDFLEAQAVEMLGQQQVALERVGRIEPGRMERREEQTEPQRFIVDERHSSSR